MATEEGTEKTQANGNRLVFAYYITGHGFGHATRGAEVIVFC